MDLQRRLDLLRRHFFSAEAHAIDAGDLLWGQQLALRVEANARVLAEELHLTGHVRILLHLLLRIPEPFIDLVDFEVELVGKLQDLLTRWSFTLQRLVHLPEGVFLALRLTRPIGALVGRPFLRCGLFGGFSIALGGLPRETPLRL